MGPTMTDPLPFARHRADSSTPPVSIDGTLSVVTFRNEDNGYTVGKVDTEGGDDDIPDTATVVGTMAGVEMGDTVRVTGRWTTHPTYGRQLAVESCEVRLPSGRRGLIQFLGGGRIKGVGPKTAEKIVDVLGTDVLQRLERNPALLATVPGISDSRARGIMSQLLDQQEAAAALVFLQEHGLGGAAAHKVWKHYGVHTVEKVRSNPYRLADEIFGIGFKTADTVARSMGHELDGPFRIAAGLSYLLGRAAMEGHVGLPAEALIERTAPFLEVGEQAVEAVLIEGFEERRLIDDGLVYRPDLYDAEVEVARHARRLIEDPTCPIDVDPHAALIWAEKAAGLELAPDQREALQTSLTHKLSVITGGPGVGKTTIVRLLVDVLQKQHRKVSLAAPTGRAARRLEQATGREAATIHRLLGIRPAGGGAFQRKDTPLDADVLIVDEMSMVDITLMASVLSALPDEACLILVGDRDQLPSVGPGEVLSAFTASGLVPVSRLTTVFRQAANSGIVRVAHELNSGEVPRFDEDSEGQAFWVERPDPIDCLQALRSLILERIPQRFGLDPLKDVQVLTPMHRGPVGTIALNENLREVLNPTAPGKPELRRFGKLYRQGDKVMQVRNNYDLEVFNGDIGRITELNESESVVSINFEGRQVEYSLDQIDQLEAAFAITCHKSQGSEFPAVLLPLYQSQFMMLRRNLVYTAFTRASRVLVAMGEWAALQRAAATADAGRRHSRLAERMTGEEGITMVPEPDPNW
ncbi:MAG: exodeoxyribonuclease V alpha subunit [Pseudohongiellaceae bacterium]|jgi:exodeoxyribonuclease V alpha subunit